MIRSLHLNEIPCFGAEAQPLQPIEGLTFVYGPNGAGKSSIAKALESDAESGLQKEVFNKEFVEGLLRPDHQIPGVFVIRDGDPDVQQRLTELLGEKSQDGTVEKIGEVDLAVRKLLGLQKRVEAKEEEISAANQKLKKVCWSKRKALPTELQSSFQGFLNDAQKHLDQVLIVRKSTPTNDLKTATELVRQHQVIGERQTQEVPSVPMAPPRLSPPDGSAVLLAQPIKSSERTSFSEFVEMIGNSDWVRHGRDYLSPEVTQCPFCQQELPESFAEKIQALFDRQYQERVHAVEELLSAEQQQLATVITFMQDVRSSGSPEIEPILKAAEALEQRLRMRTVQVQSKVDSPSSSVVLSSDGEAYEQLEKLIDDANKRVLEQNELQRNHKKAMSAFAAEVWRYYVHTVVATDLAENDGATETPLKALESMKPKLEEADKSLQLLRAELLSLQEQLTSSLPTVAEINGTLVNLGFLSFKISHYDDDDTYRLERHDGTPAGHTLSEGERTLISFLYYFHKLSRGHEDVGQHESMIAIIDDPISSLDGETLFVINLLIRRILEKCVAGAGRLKQVILLTHNAYFFKEAAYLPKGMKPGIRSYFVLNKGAGGLTSFRHYDRSPIRSNYTQLWDTVKSAVNEQDQRVSAALPNAMRRIIENYFQITGDLDTDEVVAKIPENERWACLALLSWYNDGSHTSPWDVDYSGLSSDAVTHLAAFKRIFDAAGHAAHYEMMMGEGIREADSE